jgi:hypothetical protein
MFQGSIPWVRTVIGKIRLFDLRTESHRKDCRSQEGMPGKETDGLSLHSEKGEEDWATKSDRAGQQRRASRA